MKVQKKESADALSRNHPNPFQKPIAFLVWFFLLHHLHSSGFVAGFIHYLNTRTNKRTYVQYTVGIEGKQSRRQILYYSV